ncbi:Gp138 family membrane-puncturing spike protein [Stenotrophomonas indicatrix]|uniref:Gp138 family membrane-puncturing spike protein n=1 Tax=Stenotrophomonas indicatrix TaxID=2045451 RepID=UPI003D8137C2
MSRVSDLRRLIATELAEVHTCVPGKIVSYDGRSAVVQPAISKDLASGESLAAPQIVNVPICWPCGDAGGGGADQRPTQGWRRGATALQRESPGELAFRKRWLAG